MGTWDDFFYVVDPPDPSMDLNSVFQSHAAASPNSEGHQFLFPGGGGGGGLQQGGGTFQQQGGPFDPSMPNIRQPNFPIPIFPPIGTPINPNQNNRFPPIFPVFPRPQPIIVYPQPQTPPPNPVRPTNAPATFPPVYPTRPRPTAPPATYPTRPFRPQPPTYLPPNPNPNPFITQLIESSAYRPNGNRSPFAPNAFQTAIAQSGGYPNGFPAPPPFNVPATSSFNEVANVHFPHWVIVYIIHSGHTCLASYQPYKSSLWTSTILILHRIYIVTDPQDLCCPIKFITWPKQVRLVILF